MAKKYRKKASKKNPIEGWGWLLISSAGTILFGFGLIEVAKYYNINPLWTVSIGAVITLVAVLMKKFTTETVFASKKKK